MRDIESLKAEKPVRNIETQEQFEKAVLKAKLLYDNVELYQDYQCALLYNGNGIYSNGIALVYVSSIDKKVYTEHLDVNHATFKDFDLCYMFKPVYMMIGYMGEGKENKFGVAKYNGLQIIPPEYKGLYGIQDSFIYGYKRYTASYDTFALFDYDGKVWADGLGNTEHIRWSGFIVNGKMIDRETDVIVFTDTEEMIWVYCVHKKEVYSVFKLNGHRKRVSMHFDKIRIHEHTQYISTVIKELDIKQFMGLATKITDRLNMEFKDLETVLCA